MDCINGMDDTHPRPAHIDPTRHSSALQAGNTVAKRSTAGKSWDEEEHMQFLKGLHAFGKGQWKQISRYYVPSRTPTQVASHAQKHFLRVTGNAKRKSKFAAVDAIAEVQLGSSLDRTDERGNSGRGGIPAPTPREIVRGSSSRPQQASSDMKLTANHTCTTSDETGAGRQFTNGMSLFHPNTTMGRQLVPPVQADGVAVGIPLQEIPDLSPYDGKNIPMLKVIKGRIPVTSALFRPPSPSPSQNKLEDGTGFDSDEGLVRASRRKKSRRMLNMKGEGLMSALEALADVAAGLSEGDVY
jgi:SHAQKYF class myb-like DNA-binding protein